LVARPLAIYVSINPFGTAAAAILEMLVRQPVNLLFAFRCQSPLVVIQRWNSSTRLDCVVLADGSRLAVTNPRLRISVADTSYESNLVIGGLLRLICAVISVIGGVFLIGSFLVQRRTIRS
jgi:hypothetical protein